MCVASIHLLCDLHVLPERFSGTSSVIGIRHAPFALPCQFLFYPRHGPAGMSRK